MLNIGDSVGMIQKVCKNNAESWRLVEDQINKIDITKKYGKRYHTKSRFYPLDAEDVDLNTEMMEDAANKGYIFASEVFGLNNITRPFAEKWVKWANENPDKVGSIWDAME